MLILTILASLSFGAVSAVPKTVAARARLVRAAMSVELASRTAVPFSKRVSTDVATKN